MIIAHHQGLGESANELVTKWGKGPYRYGFPDFYAAEFPVRPMRNDQSRIYAGVIGKHYPDAQTSRYHYLYDPNMYLQPGFGAAGMTADEAIRVFEQVLKLMYTWHSFDVVFDVGTSTGAYSDFDNKLWVLHGGTVAQLQQATAAAGGEFVVRVPDANLTKRIENARMVDSNIAVATLGTLDDVTAAIENMIAVLKSGEAKPISPTQILVQAAPTTWTRKKKITIAAATGGVLVVGVLAAVLLARR